MQCMKCIGTDSAAGSAELVGITWVGHPGWSGVLCPFHLAQFWREWKGLCSCGECDVILRATGER